MVSKKTKKKTVLVERTTLEVKLKQRKIKKRFAWKAGFRSESHEKRQIYKLF